MKTVKVLRLEGCGNNFNVIPDLEREFLSTINSLENASAYLQDPHFGLGGDGLMVITQSSAADFEIVMRNPDGSAMGMCGNGIRCVTRALFLQGMVDRSTKEIRYIVEGRAITCSTTNEGRDVTVDMGRPSFTPESIPLADKSEWINHPLTVDGEEFFATVVSMGNPHCVIFLTNIEPVSLESIGPKIEHLPVFPKRTNVEFVEVKSRDQLKVKVWERGAGATFACGTGACAVVVAAERLGLTGPKVSVALPGGILEIDYRKDEQKVLLTGPAREISEGEICQELLARLTQGATAEKQRL